MNSIIDKYLLNHTERPFLKHVEYFNEHDGITVDSIKNKWHELTGENKWITWLKGEVTIISANANLPKECPYLHSFTTERIMPCLKHPCDTGIVTKEGNINVDVLRDMMNTYFEYNSVYNCYYLTKSQMTKYLTTCTKRDEEINNGTPIPFLTWQTVASAEWDVFFDTFCDFEIDGEKAITADTFLQFYFKSDELYNRKLSE